MPGKSIGGWLGVGMVAAVLHVHDDAAVVAHHVPLVRRVDRAVLLHRGLDPRAHGLAALLVAEDVLDVGDVFGEALVAPGVPVFADRAERPVVAERGLDLVAIERRHGAERYARLRFSSKRCLMISRRSCTSR